MKKYKNNNITLDNKHSEFLKKFKNNEEVLIPKYKSEIKKLEFMLNKLNHKIETLKNLKKNVAKKDIDKTINIESNIITVKNKIYILEKEKSEYFLNNSKYIFNYFEEKKILEQVILQKILLIIMKKLSITKKIKSTFFLILMKAI